MGRHGIVAATMASPLQTTVSELPESRVRVDVEVAPGEVDAGLQRTARRLGRELKLPGFRRGKVPAPLVVQRLGRDAVLDQAVRDALPGWYAEAIRIAHIVPVGDPGIEVGELPAAGDALRFSIEIGVLPTAELGDYLGLEVGRGEPHVSDEQIDREIAATRERLARLETVERPAGEGDYVVIDYLGSIDGTTFDGGEGRDQLVELGAGNLIPGFEAGLIGASAGDVRTVDVTFPTDYSNTELAGRGASFEVTVKEVKAKHLPDIDEDFAIDAGFEDVAELRADVAKRLREHQEHEIAQGFRQAVLDAVVAGARVPLTQDLIHARATEMWERMLHSFSHSGVSRERYLQIMDRTEEDLLAEMAPQAEQALRREAVLTAIVAAEGIEPSEEDLLEMLRPAAERESVSPVQVLERLRSSGREDRIEELREDLAARQALDLIVDRAVPISLERAAAREKLWTPSPAPEQTGDAGARVGAERGGERGKLWTPATPAS